MGVLGAFFGCRGDGGLNGRCLGASSGDGGFMLACISGCRGVIGFNVATSQLPVREKVRPACSKWPKMSVLWRAGRTFSRVSTRGSVAGRTFSRVSTRGSVAGRTFSRVSTRGPVAGRTFSRVIPRGPAVGRTCSRVKWGRGCTGPILSAYRHRDQASQVTRRPTCRKWWGFCTTRSPLAACHRRVGPSCSANPPIGCGEAVA